MSPKAKNKSFPPVKVTEEFLNEVKQYAEQVDEYLSDFIRKAVEYRVRTIKEKDHIDNAVKEHYRLQNQQNKPVDNTHHQQYSKITNVVTHPISTDSCTGNVTVSCGKPTMVRTFPKGGK